MINRRLYSLLLTLSVLCFCLGPLTAEAETPFVLAEGGQTRYRIVTDPSPSETVRFAAEELQKYLSKITGANFALAKGETRGDVIWVGLVDPASASKQVLGFDGYTYETKPGAIRLAGVNDRAALFAVYAFLEELGCRWFAPNFDFYGSGGGEIVPRADTLRVPVLHKTAKPSMTYRKKDVAEGRSHNLANLRQMIDWMPKVGLNVFVCPIDEFGAGITVWDNWRLDLIPELKKRGLLAEIGQHGYENFLPPSTYFAEHPEWFGMRNGQRSRAQNVVFETSNREALARFLANVESYLRSHPEINIFDLWPPDGVRWSESPESLKLGTPTERHAQVVNAVARMVKEKFPRVKVEFLAYQDYTVPPVSIRFEDNTVMDFCPIARSFQTPIWDEQNKANRPYHDALKQWLKGDVFGNNISIYTYYRKYAWRSLPVVIPRLIAAETKYFKSLGVDGIGMYSEPADWFTYELNHYVLAKASMDSELDVDGLLRDYARKRFGPAWQPIYRYFEVIEATVSGVAKIPGTAVAGAPDYRKAEASLREAQDLLKEAAQESVGYGFIPELIARLQLSLQYALNDLQIRFLAWQIAEGGRGDQGTALVALLNERRDLYLSNQGKGIFLVVTGYTKYETGAK